MTSPSTSRRGPGRQSSALGRAASRSICRVMLRGMALIDKPERARQLARAIASDLTLYHEEKILEGIERDTLFEYARRDRGGARAVQEPRDAGDLRAGHLRARAGRRDAEVRVTSSRGSGRGAVRARRLRGSRPTAAGQRLDVFLAARGAGGLALAAGAPHRAGRRDGQRRGGRPSRKLRAGDVVVWTPPPVAPTELVARRDPAGDRPRGSLAGGRSTSRPGWWCIRRPGTRRARW